MVEVLPDELSQLLGAVVGESLSGGDTVDEGDFGPKHQSLFIRVGIGSLGLLVVGKSHAGAAEFSHGVEVFRGLGIGDGPTLVETVLVAADSMQIQGSTIQEKALLGVYFVKTESEGLPYDIQDFVGSGKPGLYAVQVRVRQAVPKVGVRKSGCQGEIDGMLRIKSLMRT